MELRRLDDYQSWQVSHAGSTILIDPWLTPEPITGSFRRIHSPGFREIRDLDAERLDAILLCTAVNDHTRPQTLMALAQLTPQPTACGPQAAMRKARQAGLANCRTMRPGHMHEWTTPQGGRMRATATRTGLPLGLIAVGYLVEAWTSEGASAGRIWIEPHQPTEDVAASVSPIDVALLPCQSVTAVIMPVTAGPSTSARAARRSHARVVVPTATDPQRDMSGWQRAAYRVTGGSSSLQALLGTGSTVLTMASGDLHELTGTAS